MELEKVNLIRITATNNTAVNEYIRIAKLNVSNQNLIATDRNEVKIEIVSSSAVYLIDFSGVTVGFVSYIIKSPCHVYISEVQIEPNFRSKGIGGIVLSKILEELKNFQVIFLHTHPNNRAQNLYKKFGFEVIETVQNYLGSGEPRLLMRLSKNTELAPKG